MFLYRSIALWTLYHPSFGCNSIGTNVVSLIATKRWCVPRRLVEDKTVQRANQWAVCSRVTRFISWNVEGTRTSYSPPSAWPEERNRSGRWKKENAMKRWIGERRKRDVEISWYPSDSRRWIFNNGATWRTSIWLLWTNLRRLDVIHLIQFHQTQVFKFFFKFSFKWLVIKWITFYCISLDSPWTVLSKVF